MSVEPSVSPGKLRRRRNGKEQACEPCRKAKMRCDHALPVCLKCQRRSIADRCVYLEAPETKQKVQRSRGLSLPRFSGFEQDALINPSPDVEVSGMAVEDDQGDAGIFKPSSGFYGPTSFSAVFLDNEDDLGSKIETPPDALPLTPSQNDRIEEKMSARTSLGVKVLSLLPNQNSCDYLFSLYAEKGSDTSFHKPTVLYCMSSFWSTFGAALRQPRKSRNLRDVAILLSKNTHSVLKDCDDPNAWILSLSGRNLRWEMLGILICILGKVALALPEADSFWATQSGRRMHRREFATEMKECADECVKLSSQMDNINVLTVSLLHKRLILESQCTGDTSLMLWRLHGDLNHATTGLGLHRDRHSGEPITISSEMRRRTWALMFATDKTLAAFTGRPPGLSHRYNSCPLPLDLSDEDLLASREGLDLAVSQLDSSGWKTTPEVGSGTSLRANMISSLIMSEILELSLGSESQYSEERLIELKQRNDQAQASFPPWLQFTKELVKDNNLQWFRFSLRLRYLHRSLLLEQLSVKRAHASQQRLLDVAREMIELTVYAWVERDRFVERHYDYDWMIMAYGVPSSGVICVELLRQMRSPRSTHLRLPRSEVIQNLSLLVGFLDWVRPTAANRELCGRMSAIIRRILDKVLEPPIFEGPVEREREGEEMQEWEFKEMDMVDFNWLGTLDFTQSPFLEGDTDGSGGFRGAYGAV